MAQLLKNLPYMHEDLSLDPNHSQVAGLPTMSLIPWRVGVGGVLGHPACL